MKILIVESNKSKFVIGGKKINPEEISRDNLLEIMNLIYQDKENSVFIPSSEELENIVNPVEKEIVRQIIQKISDFKENVENIRQEINSQFPPMV